MDLRPYQPDDRNACMAMMDRPGFEWFLDALSCPYFVMEHDGAIVACGGYQMEVQEKQARLVWGMVGPQWRKMGLGRLLLMYRLREIGKVDGIERVVVETTPEAAPFFEKQGFKVIQVLEDRVEMVKRLIVCA